MAENPRPDMWEQENPQGDNLSAPAESVEGRGGAKRNPNQSDTSRMQGRSNVQQALARVREAAMKDKDMRFTALLHHVYNPDMLREAYFALKRDASAGVDGETWRSYGEGLEANLHDLSARLKRGAYRARPGRSQHNALDALYVGLLTKKVNWVLDADIRGFFDAIDRDWLMRFVERRIGDRRIHRLILKWLKAGVLEDGELRYSDTGTVQGGSISPLLANIGFTHICGVKYGNGIFTVRRQTIRQRLTAKLSAVRAELRRRMHEPVPRIGKWLSSILTGHFRYYGVPTNWRLWHRALNRRSQKSSTTWERMKRLVQRYLPEARIYHDYPLNRFAPSLKARAGCDNLARPDPCGRWGESLIPTATSVCLIPRRLRYFDLYLLYLTE